LSESLCYLVALGLLEGFEAFLELLVDEALSLALLFAGQFEGGSGLELFLLLAHQPQVQRVQQLD